jgi:hypothetical protein
MGLGTVNHEPEKLRALIERYLFGEMSTEEEAQWEQHYIGCPQCLQALETTRKLSRFVKHEVQLTPELLREPEAEPSWRERFASLFRPPALRPALALASVCLVVGIAAVAGWMRVGTLQQRITELRYPSVPQVVYSLQGLRRRPGQEDQAGRPEFRLPEHGGPFLLAVPPLTATERSSVYRAHIAGSDGEIVWTSPSLGFRGRTRRFNIVCQSSFFEPGDYELQVEEVRPADDATLATFTFPFRVVPAE